jgi:hypothetical protein
MPKCLPAAVKNQLQKARDSAMLAVEVYNKPATTFRASAFMVLMCIAWTSLFHAVFLRRKVKPFYRDSDHPTRFKRIDGDYKGWELMTCLQEYHKADNPPERRNLEFLITLRNKVEHRSIPDLDLNVFGECQACLFNFEDFLFKEFGAKYAINDSLTLALQFSHLRDPQQAKATAKLHRAMASDIQSYIDTFRSGLSQDVLHDLRFSYKVFLIPKIPNNPGQADLAVEFVKFDATKPDEMSKYEKLVAFIKPVTTAVVNPGRLKAGIVCKAVQPVVQQVVGPKAKFSGSSHHVKACYFYKVRPKPGEGERTKTNTQYCQYDECHDDYVYTTAWRDFLVEEMRKPGQYEKVIRQG